MTVLGAVFITLIAFGLLNRRYFPWVLALSAAFPYSAALVVAGNTLYLFHLTAAVATLLVIFDRDRNQRAPLPRKIAIPLAVFVIWSLFITALGPMMFAGQPVLGSRTGIDHAIESQDQLGFGVSMLAQAAYLALTAGAVLYLVRNRVSAKVALLPFAVGTILGAVNLACVTWGLPWPRQLFDTSPNVLYAFRYRGGIFNEASEFAGFTVAAAALFAVLVARTKGLKRGGSIALLLLALINLSEVQAGTALAGLVLIVVAGVGAIIWRLISTGRGALLIFYTSTIGTLALLFTGSRVLAWGLDIFTGKLGSKSLNSRSSSDTFSLDLAAHTWGLGVGLGANRPSSFATMLVSCVGLIGAIAFAIFVWRAIARALRSGTGIPYAWALIAFLAAKIVSLPDLTTPGMWMLIAACLCAAGELTHTSTMTNNFPENAPEIGRNRGPQGLSSGAPTPLDPNHSPRTPRRRDRSGRHHAHHPSIRFERPALRRHSRQ